MNTSKLVSSEKITITTAPTLTLTCRKKVSRLDLPLIDICVPKKQRSCSYQVEVDKWNILKRLTSSRQRSIRRNSFPETENDLRFLLESNTEQ